MENLLGCSGWTQRKKRVTTAPCGEKTGKPSAPTIPLCGHWSAGSDSSSVLNHPGVRSQPVLPPFCSNQLQDNRKHLDPAVPRGPNLASSFSSPHFLHTLSFTSVCRSLALFPRLPLITHCKGVFCMSVMERLLSNKDCSHCGTGTTNRIFCGQCEGALSSQIEKLRSKGEKERRRKSLCVISQLNRTKSKVRSF